MTTCWKRHLPSGCAVEVDLESGDYATEAHLEVSSTELSEGRIQVNVTATGFGANSKLLLRWSTPCVDAIAFWTPREEGERWLPVNFSEEYEVSAISGSPIGALFAADGSNRLTSALSETLRPVALKFGLSARSAELRGQARIPLRAEDSYSVALILDTQKRPLTEALDSVARWWTQLGDTPLAASAAGSSPMYSTWYSLGQSVNNVLVETEAALAKTAGCGAIIVDDGWQTAGAEGGYSSCGDWIPDRTKFPDMKEHVARVKRLGMKYLLWFALPFAGEHSQAYKRFAEQTLGYRADLETWVLDPRHPDVREYLANTIVRAVADWELDGIKVDFIDSFRLHGAPLEPPTGSDFLYVDDAVDALLAKLTEDVRTLNPDILIEFRQSYVGPRLRRYCNLLRVTDCAMDATENRVHSLDLRLLAGATRIHSDMIMWHPAASTSAAARQVVNVLFAVPQISVRLDGLNSEQWAMLTFWLGLFARFQQTLLCGRLTLSAPHLSYPEARADGISGSVLATFHSPLLEVGAELRDEVALVNGSPSDELVLHSRCAQGEYVAEIYDAQGSSQESRTLTINSDPVTIAVPVSGVALLRRAAAQSAQG